MKLAYVSLIALPLLAGPALAQSTATTTTAPGATPSTTTTKVEKVDHDDDNGHGNWGWLGLLGLAGLAGLRKRPLDTTLHHTTANTTGVNSTTRPL